MALFELMLLWTKLRRLWACQHVVCSDTILKDLSSFGQIPTQLTAHIVCSMIGNILSAR